MPSNKFNFFFKILRNSVILTALFFLSIWLTVPEITMPIIKATVGFLLTYIFTELGNHYRLRSPTVKQTLCF